MHRNTKQTQKHTKIATSNKCTKIKKSKNAKMWQKQMHMLKPALEFRVLL
jgi:hypothetical protein